MDAPTIFAIAICALTLLSTVLLAAVLLTMRRRLHQEARRRKSTEADMITGILDAGKRGNRYISYNRYRNA